PTNEACRPTRAAARRPVRGCRQLHSADLRRWRPGTARASPMTGTGRYNMHASRSKFPADAVVQRIPAAAVNEHVEHGDRPHQRVFDAKLVPKIFADAPALDIGDQEENQDDGGDRAGENPEREQRSADKLRNRNGRSPEGAGPIAVAIKLRGQRFEIERGYAGIGKESE